MDNFPIHGALGGGQMEQPQNIIPMVIETGGCSVRLLSCDVGVAFAAKAATRSHELRRAG